MQVTSISLVHYITSTGRKFLHRTAMKISTCLIHRIAHLAHTSIPTTATSLFQALFLLRHWNPTRKCNFNCFSPVIFRNRQTIKGVNFYGLNSEFIMSGSDCGNFFMWDKNSEAIVQWLPGDESGVVNCLEGHPHFPIIATSGLDHDVKLWSPMNPDDVSFIRSKQISIDLHNYFRFLIVPDLK